MCMPYVPVLYSVLLGIMNESINQSFNHQQSFDKIRLIHSIRNQIIDIDIMTTNVMLYCRTDLNLDPIPDTVPYNVNGTVLI